MGASSEFCGLHIFCEVPLPELADTNASRPVNLTLAGPDRPILTPESWVHHWPNGSDVALSLAKTDGRHVLRFDDGALFDFDRKIRTVRFRTPLDAKGRHQLLDQVLPRVLEDLGNLMIHGSAIKTVGGVVVFIGDSGQGKSTLAASFQNAGVEVLSDDCLRLNCSDRQVACVPTYRSLRLWRDSAAAVMSDVESQPLSRVSDKRRFDLTADHSDTTNPISAICVLAAPDQHSSAVRFSPIAPARAVSLLLAQCFRLDPTDKDATRHTFQQCADVAERVPVVEISYPREYNQLPDVRDAVMQRAADRNWG